jgi:isoleucyl-tRNA synthetase
VVAIDETITPELKREGLMREVIRHVQAARKQAGLSVDDHIQLSLKTDDQTLDEAIREHQDTIMTETLTDTLKDNTYSYQEDVKVEDVNLTVSLQKTQ